MPLGERICRIDPIGKAHCNRKTANDFLEVLPRSMEYHSHDVWLANCYFASHRLTISTICPLPASSAKVREQRRETTGVPQAAEKEGHELMLYSLALTVDEAREFISQNKWTFAKTMPWAPHEYIVRAKVDNDKFVGFVELIREQGERRKWGRYRNVYFDIDEWSFWTMGAAIRYTIIINRGRIGETYEQDPPPKKPAKPKKPAMP